MTQRTGFVVIHLHSVGDSLLVYGSVFADWLALGSGAKTACPAQAGGWLPLPG